MAQKRRKKGAMWLDSWALFERESTMDLFLDYGAQTTVSVIPAYATNHPNPP